MGAGGEMDDALNTLQCALPFSGRTDIADYNVFRCRPLNATQGTLYPMPRAEKRITKRRTYKPCGSGYQDTSIG
jgi:hypothetical protein